MENFFTYKNQKYGHENMIPTKIGSIPFGLYYITLNGGILLLGNTLFYVSEKFTNSTIILTLRNGFAILSLLCLFLMFIKVHQVNCRYATKDFSSMTTHIEKMQRRNNNYTKCITEVKNIDGWYMIFENNNSERRCKNE